MRLLVPAAMLGLAMPAPAQGDEANPPPSPELEAARAANDLQGYDVLARREAAACVERHTGPGDCTLLLLSLLERARGYNYLDSEPGEIESWTGRRSYTSSAAAGELARKLALAAPEHAVSRFAPAQPFLLIGEPPTPLTSDPVAQLARALHWVALADFPEKADRLVGAALAVHLVRGGQAETAFRVLEGPGLIKRQKPAEEVLGPHSRDFAVLLNTQAVIAERRFGTPDREKLRQAAAILAGDATTPPLASAIVHLNLARAMQDDSDFEGAEQLYRRWLPVLAKDYPGYANVLVDRARGLGALGRGDEALALLDQTLAGLPAAEDTVRMRALMARADALAAVGKRTEADAALVAAIDFPQDPVTIPLPPTASATQPAWLTELLAKAQPAGAAQIRSRLLAEAHRRYAQALADAGRNEEAGRQVAIARKLNGRDLDAQVLEAFLKVMAYKQLSPAPGETIAARREEYEANSQLAVDARVWLQNVGFMAGSDSVPAAIAANAALGLLDLKSGGPLLAVAPFQRASKGALARIGAMHGYSDAERGELTRYRDQFRMEMIVDLVAAQMATGGFSVGGKTPDALVADAFVAAQWAEQTQAAAALGRVAARFATGKDALAALEREREDLAAQAAKAQRAYLALLGDESASGAAERSAAGTRRDELAARLAEVERKMAETDPAYADLTRPAALSTDQARALLDKDEALLVLAPAPDATYVIAVTREGVAWHRSAALAEPALGPIVDSLRAQIASDTARGTMLGGGIAKPARFDRTKAHLLYNELIKPLEGALAGKTTLMTVSSGALGKLPLALLVTDPPSGTDGDPAAEVATHWLIDRFALATLPAVSSLRALRCLLVPAGERHRGCTSAGTRIAPTRAPADALLLAGFGAPALKGSQGADNRAPTYAAAFNGPLADTAFLRKLPSLPGSLAELTAISGILPAGRSLVVTGPQATETRIKQSRELADAQYVIFSTHGLLSSESGVRGEPGLVFTPPAEDAKSPLDDGLLTASEAAELRLRAALVILSACNTAASDGSAGNEGLSGLARGFFFAGARSLMVSHWPVSDAATSALITGAFDRLQSDTAPAKALQQAILKVRAEPRWSSPAFWAPFVLVGTGS